jgi:hypothetical protein
MRILSSYDQAFKVGKEFDNSELVSNTLKYIFDEHYSCYMLCVKKHVAEVYKLESKIGDPIIDRQINKTIKRKNIKTKTKTWRVMGCVIKPFKKESTFAKEWVPFLEKLKGRLPNGLFILSLSDSVLMPSQKQGNFLPVFAYSGKIGYKDIPIPTYDDLFDRSIGQVEIDWSKKNNIAVFRGSSTGCGTDDKTNQRLKLATMRDDDLDVGITKYTSNLKFGKEIGSVKKVAPVVPSLTWKQQSEYKYILHVDGNVVAYRLLKSMLTNSVILRVKSDYIHWCDSKLESGKHYIEIKEDLSDLKEKIEWCKKHDKECKKIANRAYKAASKILTDDYIQKSFIKILKYA